MQFFEQAIHCLPETDTPLTTASCCSGYRQVDYNGDTTDHHLRGDDYQVYRNEA